MYIKKIYEDNYLLVVNKPVGLVVNSSVTAKEPTLQDWLKSGDIYEEQTDDASDFSKRTGIVHRLDKDTSGVLIIAKTPEAFENMLAQFEGRQVVKEYRAVVNGETHENRFQINAPIGRNPRNRLKLAVVADGRESLTEVDKILVISRGNRSYTVLDVKPKTGRTHQIRVHLAAINHPIASDPLYCPKNIYIENLKYFGRMMLHAYKLTVTHPVTKTQITFEASLPSEFPAD